MEKFEVPDMAFDLCIFVSALAMLSFVTTLLVQAYEQLIDLFIV